MPILFQYGPELAWLIREFKQTMTETATTASPSKRFNKQNFGFARSLKSLYNSLSNEKMKDANAAMTPLEKFPEKIQALNGIRTHDLCVTAAMLYQLAIKAP